MTVVVGFNLGTYAIIGADTRMSYYSDSMDHFWCRDDEAKIRQTKLGTITGAGSGELLDSVKARLLIEDVVHTDQIKAMIREESERALLRRMAPAHRELTRKTTWLFTYVGTGSAHPNDERLRMPGLRMAVTGPGMDYEMGIYTPGYSGILGPHDLDEGQWRRLTAFCQERLRLPGVEEPFTENVAHHAVTIWEVVTGVAKLSKSVSSKCQFGIHTIQNSIGLSGILDLNSPIELAWNGPPPSQI